jgi:hypothetical protein
MDLIAAANYGDAVVVFTNNGGGVFGYNATYGVPFYPVDIVAADLNNDGKLDLVTADYLNNTLCILTNATVFPAPGSTPSLALRRTSIGVQVSWPSATAG